jgi:hypothetical protein
LLAPLAKWGAVLAGACLAVWWVHHWVRVSAKAELERDMHREVIDAIEKGDRARQLARLRDRRKRIDEL